MSENTYKLTIHGRVRIKKNSKRIFRSKYGVRMLSSEKYTSWENVAVRSLYISWAGRRPIEGKIEAAFRFYLKNKQAEPDTSNCIEGPQDALQLAGVIGNDKQIYRIIAEKVIDANEPERVEIELKRIE